MCSPMIDSSVIPIQERLRKLKYEFNLSEYIIDNVTINHQGEFKVDKGHEHIRVSNIKEFIKRYSEDLALQLEGADLEWARIRLRVLAGDKLI